MRLVVGQGSERGRVFPLQQPTVAIGRTDANDLVLRDHGVSRRHAHVQRGPGGWVLTDLGSTNGTFVNGRQIQRGYALQPGDEVAIGAAVLLVQQEEGAAQPLPPKDGRGKRSGAGPPPALMVLAALLLVLILVGLVALVVAALRPPSEPPSPTPVNAIERLRTALPVPTQMQEMMTDIVPLIPTEFQIVPLGATLAATPEALLHPRLRAQQGNRQVARCTAVLPVAARLPVAPTATNDGGARP